MTTKMNWMVERERTMAAVDKMLKENTGKHMLDSGSIYGYGFEKRANIVYNETPTVYTVSGGFLRSTYHHLCETLSAATEENQEFLEFSKTLPENEPWDDVLKAYCEHKGYQGIRSGLTSNYDSVLDVDFMWYEIDDKADYNDRELIAIRTHNGCDIRGGYTTPTFFTYRDNYRDDSSLFCYNDLFVICENNREHRFETYDGYHWTDSDSGKTVELATDEKDVPVCPYCKGTLEG